MQVKPDDRPGKHEAHRHDGDRRGHGDSRVKGDLRPERELVGAKRPYQVDPECPKKEPAQPPCDRQQGRLGDDV
jgi:hypothetical protein